MILRDCVMVLTWHRAFPSTPNPGRISSLGLRYDQLFSITHGVTQRSAGAARGRGTVSGRPGKGVFHYFLPTPVAWFLSLWPNYFMLKGRALGLGCEAGEMREVAVSPPRLWSPCRKDPVVRTLLTNS